MKKAFFSALILIVTFPGISCDVGPIIRPDILNAAEVVEIDGYQYALDTYMYLNRQPTMQWRADRTPFHIIATVSVSDPSQAAGGPPTVVAFPDNIAMTRLWVVNGEETWKAGRLEDYGLSDDPPNLMRKKAQGAVFWADIYVDVVVELMNRSNRKRYLLKASDQYIEIVE